MAFLPKVLLVEDDRYVSSTLVMALKNDYEIDVTPSGKRALYKTDTEDYDHIILDLNLPDVSGLNVCDQMRHRGVRAPILILSAESSVLTKVNLLDAGANDYLTKPFALGELKARLRALARPKVVEVPKDPRIVIGDVVLDRESFSVFRDGIEIKLRRKEFELLTCLMENSKRVVTREELTIRAWGNQDIWTNTLDVHITYLRQKIDKPFSSALIHTVHGWGYKFEAEPVGSFKT